MNCLMCAKASCSLCMGGHHNPDLTFLALLQRHLEVHTSSTSSAIWKEHSEFTLAVGTELLFTL